jgi:hypothetical protein
VCVWEGEGVCACIKYGGVLWFTDLTVPDPFYLLPILTASTLLTIVEVGVRVGGGGGRCVWGRGVCGGGCVWGRVCVGCRCACASGEGEVHVCEKVACVWEGGVCVGGEVCMGEGVWGGEVCVGCRCACASVFVPIFTAHACMFVS